MSWVEVQRQLVAVAKATTCTRKRNGLGASFVHAHDATLEDLPDSRGFFFDISKLSLRGVLTPQFPTRVRHTVDAFVVYAGEVKKSELFEDISEDYVRLASEFVDPANWDRPTSTIMAVALGGDEYAEATIDAVGGALVLHFQLVVEFLDRAPA